MLHSVRRELPPMLRLATPIVAAEIGWMTMAVVDTMMVGRLPNSADAIGAVSLGSILFYAVAIFGTGMMLGLDTLVSHAFGAGRIEDCHHSLYNGVYLSLGMGPLLMGAIWLWPFALQRMRIDRNVLTLATPYLNALNWGLFPLLLFFVFRRYLQAINRAAPVMFALISANLVNLFGDYALIYGHFGARAMGAVGSGWATAISRMYMAIVLLGYIIYNDHRHQTGLREVSGRPNFRRIRHLVSLGVPAGAQLTIEVGVFAAAAALIAKLGAIPLASHQIALNTASFTYMVPLGIGSAAAVRVGHALGRGDVAAARLSGWTAIGLGGAFMSCMAVAFWTVPHWIVRIFTPDERIMESATVLLFVAAFFQLFDGLQAVATGALRGTGDTRTPMICHGAGYWVIGLPLGYLLCFHFKYGAPGMWTGLCLALILIGIALFLAWHRKARRNFDLPLAAVHQTE